MHPIWINENKNKFTLKVDQVLGRGGPVVPEPQLQGRESGPQLATAAEKTCAARVASRYGQTMPILTMGLITNG